MACVRLSNESVSCSIGQHFCEMHSGLNKNSATHIGRILSLSKNPLVLFTASRYFGYALQFLKALLIAGILGPEAFGLWGFLTLVSQYLGYSRLGAEYAATVFLATSARDESPQHITRSLALVMFSLIFLFLLGFVVQIIEIPIFQKFDFRSYSTMVLIVVGLQNVQAVLTNVYRVYRGLVRIAAAELLSVLIPLLAIFLFPADELIQALLGAMVLSAIMAISIFVIQAPFSLFTKIELHSLKIVIAAGIPLLLYNVSVYLITDSGKIVVSALYSVQTMGYYSFATSITRAVLLGVNAIAWVILPAVLSKVHLGVDDSIAFRSIRRVNRLYRTALTTLMLSTIIALPVLFNIMPDYKPIESTLIILLLSQIVSGIGFGYSSVSTARKKYVQAATLSAVATGISALLCLTIAWLQLDVTWIALSILVGLTVNTMLQIQLGRSLLKVSAAETEGWMQIFPPGIILAVLSVLVSSLVGYTEIGAVLAILIFIVLDRDDLRCLYNYALGSR